MTKSIRLVRIDCDKLHYHVYEGRKHENTISSDHPLESDFVEYFRTNTKEVMESIDGKEEDLGPEAA